MLRASPHTSHQAVASACSVAVLVWITRRGKHGIFGSGLNTGTNPLKKIPNSDECSPLTTTPVHVCVAVCSLLSRGTTNTTRQSIQHGKARLVPVTAPIWLGPEKTEKPPLVVGSSLADGKSGALHKATCTSDLHCRASHPSN